MKLFFKIDFKQKKKTIKYCLGLVFISLITLGLVELAILYPLSLGFARFNASQNIFEQHNLVDVYFSISKQNSNKHKWSIVIVDVTNCHNRNSLAQYITMIDSVSPRVIGIDVIFKTNECDNDSLIQVLSKTENLVLASRLINNDSYNWEKFERIETSFDIFSSISGFVNIVSENGYSSVARYFTNKYLKYNNDKDSIQSFASKIAQVAYKEEGEGYKNLENRNKLKEYINFHVCDSFKVIPANDLKENLHFLQDNVVLIGNYNDVSDEHVTPINIKMEGVKIHAYILATIEEQKFINQMSNRGARIIALFFILLTVFIKSKIRKKENTGWSLLVPLCQVVFLVLGLFIGYCVFIYGNYYIPLIYTLIGVSIAGFSYKFMLFFLQCTRRFFRTSKIK